MRTKTIIHGFKNSQKIRIIVEGFGLYMKVSDLESMFATTKHRLAVWETLEKLARDRRIAREKHGWSGVPSGIATTHESTQLQVQVDIL